MAKSTMKLPIIVICILSVILTIGLVFFERTRGNVEEMSTVKALSDEVLSLEEVLTEEDFVITLEYDENSEVKTTRINDNLCAPVVSVTKKAEEFIVEKDYSQDNKNTQKYNNEREILAKLLYCESGSTGWDCQVYTCSAILNLSDYTGRSISNMASDKRLFSVAPWVWSSTPTQTQYDVIDYVLSGGRVSGVKYFRTDYYHNFGTPVINIDNVYFSK